MYIYILSIHHSLLIRFHHLHANYCMRKHKYAFPFNRKVSKLVRKLDDETRLPIGAKASQAHGFLVISLNVSMQNIRLRQPLRVCQTLLGNSRDYCLNLDGSWISWYNNSAALCSRMFNWKYGSMTLKFDGKCCVCIWIVYEDCLSVDLQNVASRVWCVYSGYVASHYCWYLGHYMYTYVAMVYK